MEVIGTDYKVFALQSPVAKTATFTGASVEVDFDENSDMLAIANIGSAAAAVGDTMVLTVEGSPDNAAWSTVGTIPGTVLGNGGGNEIGTVSINRGVNRYFRAKATIAGATPNFTYGLILLADNSQNSTSLNSAPVV